jgi:hypothetical protein
VSGHRWGDPACRDCDAEVGTVGGRKPCPGSSVDATIEHFGYSDREMAKEIERLQAQLADANTRVGELLVENLGLLAQIVSLKTAGAEVPSVFVVPGAPAGGGS